MIESVRDELVPPRFSATQPFPFLHEKLSEIRLRAKQNNKLQCIMFDVFKFLEFESFQNVSIFYDQRV